MKVDTLNSFVTNRSALLNSLPTNVVSVGNIEQQRKTDFSKIVPDKILDTPAPKVPKPYMDYMYVRPEGFLSEEEFINNRFGLPNLNPRRGFWPKRVGAKLSDSQKDALGLPKGFIPANERKQVKIGQQSSKGFVEKPEETKDTPKPDPIESPNFEKPLYLYPDDIALKVEEKPKRDDFSFMDPFPTPKTTDYQPAISEPNNREIPSAMDLLNSSGDDTANVETDTTESVNTQSSSPRGFSTALDRALQGYSGYSTVSAGTVMSLYA